MDNSRVDMRTPYTWEVPTVMGAFLILFGVIALAAPVATSIGLAWLLGVLFIASGIVQFLHAFRFLNQPGKVSRFLLAALSLAAGIVTVRNPIAGTTGITLVLALYLLVGAMGRGLLAAELRPRREWGWMFVSSLISLALGVFLIVTLPVGSLVVPGVFFGVDLIFYGAAIIGLGMRLRRAEHEMPEEERQRAA